MMIFHQEDFDEGREEGLACLKIIAGAMKIECADISVSEMDELTTRILEKYMKIDHVLGLLDRRRLEQVGTRGNPQ